MNQKPTVLIVDDEPLARKTLKLLLCQEGYDLAFAATGVEALAQCDQAAPDLILLDVMMSDMNGHEVCQLLKSEKQFRHIPIILITALDNKDDAATGLDAGADEFLSKPVNGLELRARVRSMLRLKAQYDELQRALHLREDLGDMIVHDMRTPLTSILGFSELLLSRNAVSPEYSKYIENIHTQAQRLHRFTNDLLLLAKIEQRQLAINRLPVDINQLMCEVEQSHSVIAQSKNINLSIDLPPTEMMQIMLDTKLFQRVLDNLLSNALKFSPSGSTVTLRVEYPRTGMVSNLSTPLIRVKVIDEGPGIAPQYRERIFDKFEIASLKQENVSQIGLGLAFCKLVVEAHGGNISVTDNHPHGTIFAIEI